MSYIEQHLLPEEKVVFSTRKHPIIFMVPVIFLVLTCFLCTDTKLVVNMNNSIYQIARNIPVLSFFHRVPALFALLLTIYTGLQQWLTYVTSDYAVTNRRVVMKEGFFDRYICDTRLNTVSHVTVDQNIVAQMWNYGTITINGFGGNQDSFIQIAKPIEFQKAVQSQLDSNNRPATPVV
jgi:uncharacterized membrane protein YdbT with pleckstrin-like domain